VPDSLLARLADPSPYIVEIDVRRFALENFGKLHLLPAGQQTSEYAARVNRFNWLQLYENLGGAVFLKRAREEMVGQYDYILIDSRTGVSDTSGISTLALPDKLVVCFTLNSQSVMGASSVARIARDACAKSSDTYDIFPVPTRVDRSEKLKLQISRQVAREAFAGFPLRLQSSAEERYWGDVEVPYESFYAYEEVLAAFGDEPGELTSILASSERLASFLTGDRVYLARTERAVRKEILGHTCAEASSRSIWEKPLSTFLANSVPPSRVSPVNSSSRSRFCVPMVAPLRGRFASRPCPTNCSRSWSVSKPRVSSTATARR
jgi:hypothetical protein